MSNKNHMKFSFARGSKEWANDHLRYGISVLNGKSGMKARPEGILQTALLILEDLRERGFWWQAGILNCWIHRWQRGDFQ